MKRPKPKRKILLYAVSVAVITMGLLIAKAAQFIARSQSISACPSELVKVPSSSQQYLYPRRVVVQPWGGRHNVYGVFVIPKHHSTQWFMAIDVDADQTYCGGLMTVDASWVKGRVDPGQRVVIGLLRTRTALWLVTNGKKEQLEQPRNWKLLIQPSALSKS